MPLFALDPKGRVHMFTAENSVKPEAEWKVIALVRPSGVPDAAEANRTGVT